MTLNDINPIVSEKRDLLGCQRGETVHLFIVGSMNKYIDLYVYFYFVFNL